jgi:DNA-binding transcriptional MerR regulator
MVSPLSQMQRRYLKLGNSREAIAEILALYEIRPEIADNLNLDQHVRNIAESYGIDKRVLVDMADVERLRQARARQQEMMRQQAATMAALDTGSKAAANISKATPETVQAVAGAMGAA